MSEMVERVAKAIRDHNMRQGGVEPASDMTPFEAQHYTAEARAAIAAMREPTEAMVLAGDDAQTDIQGPDEGIQVAMCSSVPWQAMIDAALSPSTSGTETP